MGLQMEISLPKALIGPYRCAGRSIRFLDAYIAPLFTLALRLYLAEIFFRAGWLKISAWSSTLDLFNYVYQVPLLPPYLAAVMGTAGELFLPLLLVAGLAGRFAAASLSLVNLMAAISFPDISELGLHDHTLWGVLLAVIFFHGPGRFSLDAWLSRKLSTATE